MAPQQQHQQLHGGNVRKNTKQLQYRQWRQKMVAQRNDSHQQQQHEKSPIHAHRQQHNDESAAAKLLEAKLEEHVEDVVIASKSLPDLISIDIPNSDTTDHSSSSADSRSINSAVKEFIMRRRMADLSHAFVFPLFILQTSGIIVGPCLPPPDFDFHSVMHNKIRIDDEQVEKRLCPDKQFFAEVHQQQQALAAATSTTSTDSSSGSSFRRSSTLMRRAECRTLQRVSRVLNVAGIFLLVAGTCACLYGLVQAARDGGRVKVGVTFAIIQLIWLLKQLAVALLLRRAWAGPLKEIVWKWRTSKCICILKQQVIYINRVSYIVFTIGLALTALNMLMSVPIMYNMLPDSQDLQKYIIPRFESEFSNRLIQTVYILGSFVVASYCYLVPCLIILITYVLCKEFERVNQLLTAEYDRERRTLNVEVALLRSWHQNICFLVDKCDEAFSNIIAVTAAADIFNAVFLLYQILDSYTTASTSVLLSYTYWTFGHVAKWVCVSLMCARVHEVAHRPLSVLFNIDAQAYAPKVDDHNARLELLLFTGKLSSSLRIGITAGGVVTLTRNAVTSLITFFLTLVLVMFQLKQKVF